jgi:hypothetical protein
MRLVLRRHLPLLGFLLLCSVGTISAAWNVRNLGDGLSRVDPFSEANTIREVWNFREYGIASNEGLGNVLRPGMYPDEGFAGHPEFWPHSLSPTGVYTHYPPGPEYLLYAATKIFGPSPVSLLRIVPLVICWGAALFFGLAIWRRFGATVGYIVMFGCSVLPVFTDANAYLHYDGYAFALLLIEIGLILQAPDRTLGFLFLGFLQGWLSFDYFFLIILAPLALELALSRMPIGHVPCLRRAFVRSVAAGTGFAIAHAVHFAEVCAYFGSFSAALHDLGDAAAYRSGMEQSGGLLAHLQLMKEIVQYYFVGPYPVSTFFWDLGAHDQESWRAFRFLGFSLGLWWLLLSVVAVVAALRGVLKIGDWLIVSLCGFVPAMTWMFVMTNHAVIHHHFLYRHLFICFLVWLLFTTTNCLRARAAWTVGTPAVASGRLDGGSVTGLWRALR